MRLQCPLAFALALTLLLAPGCEDAREAEMFEERQAAAMVVLDTVIEDLRSRAEQRVEYVKVQHVLLAFDGSGVGGVTRTREQAKALAADVLRQSAQADKQFGDLVRDFTDDSHPGIYALHQGGGARPSSSPRTAMVKGFGDVAFRLEVGEVGVAAYHKKKSPFGWHVIKRLE